MPNSHILVVEDDSALAEVLVYNIRNAGYDVTLARDGNDGLQKAKSKEPDLVVLDVMLPDVNGFELCKRFRDAGNFVPVIMLTARSSPEDRVLGLEAGADDYMVKPFELGELLARVRSVLRRQRWEQVSGNSVNASTLSFGNAQINFDTHEVQVGGEEVQLTQLELDLLRYFAANAGRVLSRTELLERVWKLRNYSNTRTVDNFISRLRRRFEKDPSSPTHFLSVRGAGYKFTA